MGRRRQITPHSPISVSESDSTPNSRTNTPNSVFTNGAGAAVAASSTLGTRRDTLGNVQKKVQVLLEKTGHMELEDSFIDKENLENSWHCGDVILPDSKIQIFWDNLMAIMILYTLVVVPLEVAFVIEIPVYVDILITLGFFANILISFRTAVQVDNKLILDKDEIASHYLHNWFILDVIATVPWDLIFSFWLGQGSKTLLSTRLLRLFRLLRMLSASDTFSLRFSKTALRLGRMVSYAIAVGHWLGCAWYLLSEVENFSGNGIVANSAFEQRTLGYRYFRSLQWGLWALVSMGSELHPDTTYQVGLSIVCIFAGVYVFATIIGNIEVLLTQSASNSIRFQEIVTDMNEFFHHKHVPSKVQHHIMEHIQHIWRSHRGIEPARALAILPAETRNRVYRFLYKRALKDVELFCDCDDAFVDCLCTHVRQETALPGDIIIRQGSIGEQMYIMKRGRAEAVDLVSGYTHSSIEEGKFFGEIALFTSCRRTVSVRATDLCELLVLSKGDFMNVLSFFPEEEERFLNVANNRVAQSDNLLQKLQLRVMSRMDASTLDSVIDNSNARALFQARDIHDVIAKFDKDGDGQLDEHEQRSMQRFLEETSNAIRLQRRLDTSVNMIDENMEADAIELDEYQKLNSPASQLPVQKAGASDPQDSVGGEPTHVSSRARDPIQIPLQTSKQSQNEEAAPSQPAVMAQLKSITNQLQAISSVVHTLSMRAGVSGQRSPRWAPSVGPIAESEEGIYRSNSGNHLVSSRSSSESIRHRLRSKIEDQLDHLSALRHVAAETDLAEADNEHNGLVIVQNGRTLIPLSPSSAVRSRRSEHGSSRESSFSQSFSNPTSP